MTSNKNQNLNNAANITNIANKRVEQNLRVLKLLKDNDVNISAKTRRLILNEYTGWGGLRDAIYDPYHVDYR